jgi:hypothetical protein
VVPKPVSMLRLAWGFWNHHFFQFTDLLYFFAQKIEKDHTRAGYGLLGCWPWAKKNTLQKGVTLSPYLVLDIDLSIFSLAHKDLRRKSKTVPISFLSCAN